MFPWPWSQPVRFITNSLCLKRRSRTLINSRKPWDDFQPCWDPIELAPPCDRTGIILRVSSSSHLISSRRRYPCRPMVRDCRVPSPFGDFVRRPWPGWKPVRLHWRAFPSRPMLSPHRLVRAPSDSALDPGGNPASGGKPGVGNGRNGMWKPIAASRADWFAPPKAGWSPGFSIKNGLPDLPPVKNLVGCASNQRGFLIPHKPAKGRAASQIHMKRPLCHSQIRESGLAFSQHPITVSTRFPHICSRYEPT